MKLGHCGIDGDETPATKAFFNSRGIRAGQAKSRRSFRPILTTEHADLQDVLSGSDGTRTRDLRRDRPAFSVFLDLCPAVVLLENGLQSVGEGVGGIDPRLGKPLVKPSSGQRAPRSHPGGRRFESG